MGFGADLLKKCGHQSLKTAKIGIRTPVKSANYFRLLSQTRGDERTGFLSRMQHFVKIGKELLLTYTQTDGNKLTRGSVQCIG